ncbi:hypothetical protein [Desulfoscipio sp. XC116]|uniref:hypothetical protein n=1 Tax=Desulfoscipio sp. XC116 TaxID=3144975 RepID=UPI00325B98DB
MNNKRMDYRINFRDNCQIISIEITCCEKHIGEIRYKDGESKQCPDCGAVHSIKIQHNHFHLTRSK